ncbi:hypothetical protein M404DRAFT_36044 [Pisolithus tinctorius Marx 270]|uniref:Uncharacterized protein n=1 Tax=Pisolithus tinctorius Marx 270 TaxID=870435 RepID=A0A0C3NCD7_PISTI|nr:hypothetical protein M404DRAFT_36044 [Pisolithus tinctorius Marx 270]
MSMTQGHRESALEMPPKMYTKEELRQKVEDQQLFMAEEAYCLICENVDPFPSRHTPRAIHWWWQ